MYIYYGNRLWQEISRICLSKKQSINTYEKDTEGIWEDNPRQANDIPTKSWKFVKSKTKSPSNIPNLYKEEESLDLGLANADKVKVDILSELYFSHAITKPFQQIFR